MLAVLPRGRLAVLPGDHLQQWRVLIRRGRRRWRMERDTSLGRRADISRARRARSENLPRRSLTAGSQNDEQGNGNPSFRPSFPTGGAAGRSASSSLDAVICPGTEARSTSFLPLPTWLEELHLALRFDGSHPRALVSARTNASDQDATSRSPVRLRSPGTVFISNSINKKENETVVDMTGEAVTLRTPKGELAKQRRQDKKDKSKTAAANGNREHHSVHSPRGTHSVRQGPATSSATLSHHRNTFKHS
ncbi:hypothetical protein CF328_g8954 [Tilletia controversa]|nr:hypothetical protein CF328_g8954 [Tilletia controversa]